MKTLLSFFIILFSNLIIAQTTAIPDANFEQELINLGLDITLDGQVLTTNIDTLTVLDISSKNISDLTGIQGFTSLTKLICYNNLLNNLDVTHNIALTYLDCNSNTLSSLDVTNNTNLDYFRCDYNQLTSIDVTQNAGLSYFACGFNQLTTLDVTQNINLSTYLGCTGNQLMDLDLSQNPNLEILYCNANKLDSLDLSQNPLLATVNCSWNQLSFINLTGDTSLYIFHCPYNQLTTLDVTQFQNLGDLTCDSNFITSLDLTQNPNLYVVRCNKNPLSCLNIKNGNNSSMPWSLFAQDTPNLTCIEVDNVAWSNANWTNIDAQTSFSSNCNNTCSIVGIEENRSSTLSLYPNPTTGNISIDLGGAKQNLKVTLTNSLGQIILTKQLEFTDFINMNIVAPKGIYFLKIESAGGVINTSKVIKE